MDDGLDETESGWADVIRIGLNYQMLLFAQRGLVEFAFGEPERQVNWREFTIWVKPFEFVEPYSSIAEIAKDVRFVLVSGEMQDDGVAVEVREWRNYDNGVSPCCSTLKAVSAKRLICSEIW